MTFRYIDLMPDGWAVVATDSGYITEDVFYDWLTTQFIPCAKPSAEDPCVLLLDNHSAHISARILQTAVDHHLVVVNQPPHSSHFLQPLDNIFGLLKDGVASSSHAAQLIDGSAQVLTCITSNVFNFVIT